MPLFSSAEREETVPRGQYDLLREMFDLKCTEYNALLDKYNALRPTHAPTSPAKVIRAGKSADEVALANVEKAAMEPSVGRAFAALRMQGVPESEALAEATRMIESVKSGPGPLSIG